MPAPEAPSLQSIARLSLKAGRILLETGANGRTVTAAIENLARGFGCTWVEVYCQHSALIVMLERDTESLTQMGKVGEHGVNLRSGEAVLHLIDDAVRIPLSVEETRARFETLPGIVHRYPAWLVCLATGLACASFGRLLGLDWAAFAPVLIGSGIGQWLRLRMFRRGMNFYFVIISVAFVSAALAGWGGRLLGSTHLDIATVAATLLLIPGPAMLNSQIDALDGKPNLAVARAFRIMQIIIFLTLGLIAAQHLIGL